MEIKEIIEPRQKQAIAREILEALPEWFGIPQAREQYIAQSAGQPFFAALQEERPIGFCCLMPKLRSAMITKQGKSPLFFVLCSIKKIAMLMTSVQFLRD